MNDIRRKQRSYSSDGEYDKSDRGATGTYGIRQACKWIVDIGNVLAQVGDRIPKETIAIMVHWLLFIIACAEEIVVREVVHV